jgi:hypothetical protein
LGQFGALDCTDPDNDGFTYNWYWNGSLQTTSDSASSWNYNTSFYDSGERNVTLLLNDTSNQITKYYWNVSVIDLNAPPFLYSNIPNLTAGWDQNEARNMNLSIYFYDVDGENLSYTWYNYAINETFYGETNTTILDRWSFTGDWGIINLSGDLKLSQLNTSGTNFGYYTQRQFGAIRELHAKIRFPETGIAGLCIRMHDNTCANSQRIYLNSTDNSTYWGNISGGVAFDSNSSYNFDINLNTHYWLKITYSTNNTLVYVSNNGTHFNLAYNISYPGTTSTSSVGLYSPNSKAYGNQTRESNQFYLVVDEINLPDPIVQQFTTHSSSTVQQIKVASLDIIVPSLVSLAPLAKTLVPVILNNSGEQDLSLLDLMASTNETSLKLLLNASNFTELLVGQKIIVNLEITAGILTPDRYSILLDAFVKNPSLHEQAEIVIDVREKDAAIKTQLKEQIQFTRDLFLQNPECLELNELLEQAQRLYDLKQFNQGLELVHQANEGCKNFISDEKDKREEERKGILKAKNFFLENWKAITIEVAALILAILLLMYYFKRRSFKKAI